MTVTITIVTPDTQQTTFDRIDPRTNDRSMSMDRIASYITSLANGSNKLTSASITVGALPTVNL